MVELMVELITGFITDGRTGGIRVFLYLEKI